MTKVVVGIIKKENSYLLVSSKKDFGKYSGFYYPVGGHVEGGESEEDALRREINEEVGLKVVSLKKITETESDIENQTTSWYDCEVKDYNFKINQEEIADVKFFTKEEMKKINLWPATQKFFEKFIL